MAESTANEKVRPQSPIEANRNITPLNSALMRKIWLKIEQSSADIDQAFAVQFNETDNIDDLKTKVLEKLNKNRWSYFLDNTSIAIGFYGVSIDADGANETFTVASPVESSTMSNRYRACPSSYSAVSPTLCSPKPVENSSNIGSPQRSRSNSMGIPPTIPRSPLVRYPSPYCNLHSFQKVRREFSPVQMLSTTPLNSVRNRFCGFYKKNYKMVTQADMLDPEIEQKQILFEPDDLVVNIYSDIFGRMGSQKASEALCVFSANHGSPYILPTPLDTFNVATFIPTNEEIARQILETEDANAKDDVFSLHTPPPPNLNISEENGAPDILHSRSEQEEIEREFKFITDEEQLLKESRSYNDTERYADQPKPAILLLPKGHTGEVDFSESTSKEAESSSEDHGSAPDVKVKPDLTLTIPPYAPLDENEVGLIHPLLESGRKNLESTTNSPVSAVNLGTQGLVSSSASQRPLPSGEATASTSTKVFPKITVLIVEDNVINQTILCSFLRKHKISYKVAKNGQEAVDKWKEGGIDLIFMDLQLPVLSGTEAAKQIRDLEKQRVSKNDSKKSAKKAPVIIVAFTASNSQSVKTNALISGCNDYLTKPVNLHWLSKKINEWGCMQALIDFDGWKEGQSRMTERLLMKASPKLPAKPELKSSSSSHRVRSSSNSSHSRC